MIGGVGDREEMRLGQPVGEQVVEHAAVLAAQHAVLGAALGEPPHIIREHALQKLLRLRPARLHLTHVRDVEDTGVPPDGEVLLANARVVDRHLPAGEGHELGTGVDMLRVKRRSAEGRLGSRAHGSRLVQGAEVVRRDLGLWRLGPNRGSPKKVHILDHIGIRPVAWAYRGGPVAGATAAGRWPGPRRGPVTAAPTDP